MNVKNYLRELKNGKQLRIKFNGRFYDEQKERGWWSEELYLYNKTLGMFLRYYPTSSYDKDFYIVLSDFEAEYFIREAIDDYEHMLEHGCEGNKVFPVEFVLEKCDIPDNHPSIREFVMQKISGMTDDQLRGILPML